MNTTRLKDRPKRLRTPREAKALLVGKGISVAKFARELGVHQNTVWEVLGGRRKAAWGDAHKVAVALGMKRGEILPSDASLVEAVRRDRNAA